MEIISKGKKLEEYLYTNNCHYCKSVFSCYGSEGKIKRCDLTHMHYLEIQCPVCSHILTTHVDKQRDEQDEQSRSSAT